MADAQAAGALVLFGITGDLARKSLLPALYRMARSGTLTVPVVGVVRGSWTAEKVRERAREAIVAAEPEPVDERDFETFAALLRTAKVDYADPATFTRIAEEADGRGRLAHYLAIPPELFTTAANGLAHAGLNRDARLVVEKPFGHDLASARALQKDLTRDFPEDALRRVDHFLGKDTVWNLLALRSANTLLDAALTRGSVRSVQLTLAEDFGVADRGSFYDKVGAVRDVVQNHLLQTLAMFVMEPPADGTTAALLDAKAAALRAVRTVAPDDYVAGQYAGYREIEGVASDSRTETYAALRTRVDTERWAGVPFSIRTGKCLDASVTEIVVELTPRGDDAAGNLIRFRVDPGPGVTFDLLSMGAGSARDEVPATAAFGLAGDDVAAYENVLTDALTGDRRRFPGMDEVEESWRIVGDILTPAGDPVAYEPGGQGPAEAGRLTTRGQWFGG